MILLYVLSTFVLLCYGQNAELEFKEKCSKDGDTLTIEAVYTGSGTPQLITWTYSGSSLSGDTSGCSLLGTPPAGFPDSSRLSFICVSANTYQLEVSDFQANESDKTWAVTFTPPVGTAPAAVQETVPSICSTPTTTLPPTTDCKCECVCKWRYLVYVSIAFGILGALVLLTIVVGIQTGRFEKKKTLLLASDGIGVFCDVLSFVFNIAFQSKKSCEASENCEDSECCKEDSDCCKGSINVASIAFIVIPIVVGFISVVIFVLVKLDKIKLGRKAYKAKEPGENHGMTGTSM